MLITLEDPTYNIGFVTSAIETNLALITASVPALTPLLRTWFPSWFGGGPSGGNGVTKNNYVDIPPKGTMQPIRRINLRDLKRDNGSLGSRGIAELRSHSPSRSEEEMMTMNGIVRTTDMAVNGDIGMSRQYPTQQQPQMSRYDGGYSRPAFADPPRSRGAPSAGWEPDPGAMGQSRYMDRNRF